MPSNNDPNFEVEVEELTPPVCQELVLEAEKVEQFIAPVPSIAIEYDPQFHSIEENIDELERRIKSEERRYVSLMENCHYY